MRGAGGTEGGAGLFLIGVTMMVVGFYLLLNAIIVNVNFGFGMRMFGVGGVSITSGMIMLPFVAGVIFIFYNSKNPIGWLLAIGSLAALFAGVLVNTQFRFARMSAFDLVTILILAFGGLGLFLRSLRTLTRSDKSD